MAYISQQTKKELAPAIKSVLKKFGVKGTVAVDNHSSLVVNIKEGIFDFIGIANEKNKEIAEQRGTPYYPNDGYIQVNTYHTDTYGEASEFFSELVAAMKVITGTITVIFKVIILTLLITWISMLENGTSRTFVRLN